MKRAVCLSIGFVLLVGCGSKHDSGASVSGSVTYNGQPVGRATLFFHPTSGEGNDVDVMTGQDGTFSVTNILPGEYKIYLEGSRMPAEATKGPKTEGVNAGQADEMKKKFEQMRGGAKGTIAFPNKYKKADTSDLKCTITKGKSETLKLELKD